MWKKEKKGGREGGKEREGKRGKEKDGELGERKERKEAIK